MGWVCRWIRGHAVANGRVACSSDWFSGNTNHGRCCSVSGRRQFLNTCNHMNFSKHATQPSDKQVGTLIDKDRTLAQWLLQLLLPGPHVVSRSCSTRLQIAVEERTSIPLQSPFECATNAPVLSPAHLLHTQTRQDFIDVWSKLIDWRTSRGGAYQRCNRHDRCPEQCPERGMSQCERHPA